MTVAGCESLLGLKGILRAYRDPHVGLPQITPEVSNAKRLQTIHCLDGEKAYIDHLKKCHLHRLFIDNTDPLCTSNDSFIISTTKSFVIRARGESGNPRNSAESRTTKSMMKEVYPEVNLDSTAYKKKVSRDYRVTEKRPTIECISVSIRQGYIRVTAIGTG